MATLAKANDGRNLNGVCAQEAANRWVDTWIALCVSDGIKVAMSILTEDTHHDVLLPHLSSLTSLGRHVRQHIERDGYVVLPGVLSRDECACELERLWDFVEATAPGVKRTEPDTWYPPPLSTNDDLDPWPHSGWKFLPDMCQSFGGGWLFSNLREVLAERVFEPLYGTYELHSSKEGFTFYRPTSAVAPNGARHPVLSQEKPRVCKLVSTTNGEHFDQCATDTGLHCIQSSTAFLDQEESDGCFLCWPGSHHEHARITKDIWRGRSDWVPLTDAELELLSSLGLSPRRVPVKAGDVILWRSDLVHCGARPLKERRGFRAVSYTCMLPASLTPPHVFKGKLDEYVKLQSGDHRPNIKMSHLSAPKKQHQKHKKGKPKRKGSKGASESSSQSQSQSQSKSQSQPQSQSQTISQSQSQTISQSQSQIISQSQSQTISKGHKGHAHTKVQLHQQDNDLETTTTTTSTMTTTTTSITMHTKVARGTYFPHGPPRLTWRQAELYGLVRYNCNARKHTAHGHASKKGGEEWCLEDYVYD